MDWKKATVLVLVLLFAGVAISAAAGVLPTSNASVVVDKEKQDSIKGWAQQAYGVTLTDLDANISDTFISDNNKTCTVYLYKEGLFNGAQVSFSADNNTCLDVNRNTAIKAKYEQVAEVYQQRLDRTQNAQIGSGSVEIKEK